MSQVYNSFGSWTRRLNSQQQFGSDFSDSRELTERISLDSTFKMWKISKSWIVLVVLAGKRHFVFIYCVFKYLCFSLLFLRISHTIYSLGNDFDYVHVLV